MKLYSLMVNVSSHEIRNRLRSASNLADIVIMLQLEFALLISVTCTRIPAIIIEFFLDTAVVHPVPFQYKVTLPVFESIAKLVPMLVHEPPTVVWMNTSYAVGFAHEVSNPMTILLPENCYHIAILGRSYPV